MSSPFQTVQTHPNANAANAANAPSGKWVDYEFRDSIGFDSSSGLPIVNNDNDNLQQHVEI